MVKLENIEEGNMEAVGELSYPGMSEIYGNFKEFEITFSVWVLPEANSETSI